jgi:tRNA C32,U32 (ribose-2'-O)-methylase TrmJ
MRRLRRLYTRAVPDANEMNILRGILTATEQALSRAAAPPLEPAGSMPQNIDSANERGTISWQCPD